MARKPAETALEVIDPAVNTDALASASQALTTISQEALQIQAAFGLESLAPEVLTMQIQGLIEQTGRTLFQIGARLMALRVQLPAAEYKAVLASLNMAPKSATRMMSAAMKCVDSNGATRDTLLSLPQAKVLELVTLDDEKLDELEKTGGIGQLALELDEIDRMSPTELRAKLRRAELDLAAKDKVLAKKGQEIDRLHEEAAARTPEDEQQARIDAQVAAVREATVAAEIALAQFAAAAGDAINNAESEACTTAARTSAEYIAQRLADFINLHGLAVQFEQMVTPEWMAADKPAKKR